MKGYEYYGERLLSQAIGDPSVNALDADEVREYIEQQAEALCLDPAKTADAAMRGYYQVTAADFNSVKQYRRW